MDRLKELEEAKQAANEVLSRIDNAVKSLNGASSWGFWDLIGGEFFSSIMKRSKIQEANNDINEISVSLYKLNKELEDVNMSLPSEISNTLSDNFFDVWFDNIFTDIRVQGEIKETLIELKNFRNKIVGIINELDLQIKDIK